MRVLRSAEDTDAAYTSTSAISHWPASMPPGNRANRKTPDGLLFAPGFTPTSALSSIRPSEDAPLKRAHVLWKLVVSPLPIVTMEPANIRQETEEALANQPIVFVLFP